MIKAFLFFFLFVSSFYYTVCLNHTVTGIPLYSKRFAALGDTEIILLSASCKNAKQQIEKKENCSYDPKIFYFEQ